MVEVNKTHLWVSSLALAAIAEADTGGEIKTAVFGAFGRPDFFDLFQTKRDLVFFAGYGDTLYTAVSGTRNARGWARNLWIRPLKAGWHPGFVDSATDLFMPMLTSVQRFCPKRVVFCGHSAGHAIALRLAYDLGGISGGRVEHVGFCGPQTVNKEGREALRRQRVNSTAIQIGKEDQVDDVAKLVGGVNYSLTVKLPSDGKPGLCKIPIIDRLFWGHAPSYVWRCLIKYFKYCKNMTDGEKAKIIGDCRFLSQFVTK